MARRTERESVPVTLPTQHAIELLRKQLARIDEIKQLRHDNPEVKKWAMTTENILDGAYGKPDGRMHKNTSEFAHCVPERIQITSPWISRVKMTDEAQNNHIHRTERRQAILESIVEQLEILAPPAAAGATHQYSLHPEIDRVSGNLFRDGHFKPAALEAYIRVIEEVKRRSGIADDGDSLMNRAFGCDKQTPVIQFNSLQTDAERDEQKGLMFIFKGIVGLRNYKAHTNTLFDDPYRAHDYLALASLLMRLLEIAAVNPRA